MRNKVSPALPRCLSTLVMLLKTWFWSTLPKTLPKRETLQPSWNSPSLEICGQQWNAATALRRHSTSVDDPGRHSRRRTASTAVPTRNRNCQNRIAGKEDGKRSAAGYTASDCNGRVAGKNSSSRGGTGKLLPTAPRPATTINITTHTSKEPTQ